MTERDRPGVISGWRNYILSIRSIPFGLSGTVPICLFPEFAGTPNTWGLRMLLFRAVSGRFVT